MVTRTKTEADGDMDVVMVCGLVMVVGRCSFRCTDCHGPMSKSQIWHDTNRPPSPLMEVNSPFDSSAGAAAVGCLNSMTVGRPYQVISGADTTGVEYKCGGRSALSLSL